MRISDWSSDVCSSDLSTLRSAILDLLFGFPVRTPLDFLHAKADLRLGASIQNIDGGLDFVRVKANKNTLRDADGNTLADNTLDAWMGSIGRSFFDKMFRSEEHTSELQSLMRTSYAVFCL